MSSAALMVDISSSRAFIMNLACIRSAAPLLHGILLPMTLMRSSRALFIHGFFFLLRKKDALRIPGALLNRLPLNSTIFIVPCLSLRKSLTISRAVCFATAPHWQKEKQKSFTMTALTSILKSNRRRTINSMASARRTALFPSWRWDCSWMRKESPSLLASSREMTTSRIP